LEPDERISTMKKAAVERKSTPKKKQREQNDGGDVTPGSAGRTVGRDGVGDGGEASIVDTLTGTPSPSPGGSGLLLDNGFGDGLSLGVGRQLSATQPIELGIGDPLGDFYAFPTVAQLGAATDEARRLRA
jgi:hypothetical protein